MTDKELLELAALAVGIELGVCPNGHSGFWDFDWNGAWWTLYVSADHPTIKMPEHCGKEFTQTNCNDGQAWEWNPLTDDGDALRLAVKLGLLINPWPQAKKVYVGNEDGIGITEQSDDLLAATRRAIVRVAANIGQEIRSA